MSTLQIVIYVAAALVMWKVFMELIKE